MFRLDRRITPDEVAGAAEDSISDLVRESVRTMPGIRVNVRRIMLAHPFVPSAGQETLVLALNRSAMDVFGLKLESRGLPLFTDARHYSEAGVPTVLYGAGPRTLEEANGHRAD